MVPPPPATATSPPVKRPLQQGQSKLFSSERRPHIMTTTFNGNIPCSVVWSNCFTRSLKDPLPLIHTSAQESAMSTPDPFHYTGDPSSSNASEPIPTSGQSFPTTLPTADSTLPSPDSTSPVLDSTPTSLSMPFNNESTGYPTLSSTSSTLRAASTNTGAIAGGVIGGVALLALLAASAFILIRHRRKSRPPPSAEFMHLARGASALGFATMDGKTSPTLHSLIPLARQSSLEVEDEPEERPLEFVPEGYRDPVLEKAQESAAMREKYGRSEEGGYQ